MALSELNGTGEVEVLVDNEIAVQNLTKMAQQKGLVYSAEKSGRAGIRRPLYGGRCSGRKE